MLILSRLNNTHTTTRTIISLFLAFILIAGTIVTTNTVSVYGQGKKPPLPNAPVTQDQLQQILTNYTTHEELQQILNQIEVCPAGTTYEGFFVNGDGNQSTTVPEDEVMTEICIPTAQLNVIKTTTCNVEKFGQEFCNSIREPKISVLGNNPTPSFFFGTGPLGTNVSLGPGAYHVDEAGFTEGLESCQMKGFDGGRNLVSDSIFICTNFSDECQGDITLGIPQTCTIDNNVLGEANFLDIVTAHIGSNTVSILLGTGIGTFGTATTFPAAGDTPTSVAVGDFNGDDVLDIATANFISHDISVLLGNGDGTFGTATTFPVAPAINPRSIAVGDFNGDDVLDIATANRFSHDVSILLGNGDGTFGTATTFPVAPESGPHDIAVGDFNGDDKSDIATANEVSDNVSILLGTGTGTFGTATALPLPVGLNIRHIALGDFNGDDKLDIATNAEPNDISVLLGNGDGTFGTATTFPVAGDTPLEIAVGDFNGDDVLDIATANFISSDISILLGKGDGTFGTATTFPVGLFPGFIAVGDFNSDFVLDIASNGGSNTISILLGTGTGTFGTATTFPVGSVAGPIAVGEFGSKPPTVNNACTVWTDTTPGNAEIFFARSTDGGQTFNDSINISNNTGGSQNPQVICEGNNVYVVWQDNTPGNFDIFFARSTDGGQTFREPDNLSENAGNSVFPHISTEGNNVYVVWQDNTPGNFDILFARSTDDGATFSTPPDNLNQNAGDSRNPQISVEGNNVYVVWRDETPGNSDIFFARSTDGGQTFSSPPDNISENEGFSNQPHISTEGNNVYVVWQDNTLDPFNFDIFFTASTDGGQTFSSPPDNISENEGDSGGPIEISSEGNNVYVVWVDDTPGNADILFVRSTDGGQTFSSPPDNLSENEGISVFPQISSEGNNVYVVWIDTTPGNPDIFFARSTDGGATFSTPPHNLSENAGGPDDEQPQISTEGNNVYVVWQDNTPGNFDILFARSTDNGLTFSTPPDNISETTGFSGSPQISSTTTELQQQSTNNIITTIADKNNDPTITQNIVEQKGQKILEE